ncbi:Na/Pi cotransporter family protein [Halomonas sp. TBZ9]|uniref:Na/Pi cotransporter family protein n=1 Tax=Vreelandella azerica TaxID=2732867 RepID=A0A7Y3TWN0_9GAMM|nr:Na/Pi symporter [Halomonas azerica]NOG31404.1 Na/Pi cotransporter family protein [Halomonas azerica]
MPFAAQLGHWRKHAHTHPAFTTRLVIIGLIAATAVLMSYLDLATLAAGLGLFLWGMQYLEKGIKQLSGGKLGRWLQQATRTRPRAILFGAATTATVQSSSLMTLLSMSFVSAGLVTLPAGIALLFGANLGTTTGAWLMATFGLSFDLARYAMPFLAAGLLGARLLPKSLRGYAHLLMGIGLLFLGIDFMKLGFSAWQDSLSLAGLAGTQFWHWPLYVLFGVIATVVMQSSHATLLIILTALASGQLDYLPALAVAVGANVGTTVTALLGALGASTAAQRLAGAHIVFNLLTAGVALTLLLPLAWLVDFSSTLIGIDADAWPLKLALFHTLFNVLGIVLMLPFITPLAKWLERLLPSPAHHLDRAQARYLDASALQHSDTALSALDQECRRLERRAYHLLCNALLIHSADALGHLPTREKVEQAIDSQHWPAVNERYHERIKPLLSEILAFYARLEVPMADDQQAYLEARLQQTFRLVEAVRFGEVLQRSLLRHTAPDSPLREGHDALRLALAKGLNYLNRRSEENTVSTSTLAEPIYTASQFWQEETARRLRQQRLTPAQASTLMNDFHQASRLIDALMPSMASEWQYHPSPD